jgi:xanthine dehydrogenase accessory factor
MADWAETALRDLRAGRPCALVSIVAVKGSAPREAGTRMLVGADSVTGSIGGGNLEFQAIRQARLALAHPPGSWRLQDYPLGPLLGQCCGGQVRLLIERLDPARLEWLQHGLAPGRQWLETRLAETGIERRLLATQPEVGAANVIVEPLGAPPTPLLLCGAGHVGRAVARVIDGLPFALTWLDSRPDQATAPDIMLTEPDRMADQAHQAPDQVLIMTHDHALDYQLTAAALLGPAHFIGLIGSNSKRARFLSRLGRDGFAPDSLARLTCPIGLKGIDGKAPAVIAVAVAAQLLTVRRRPGEDA